MFPSTVGNPITIRGFLLGAIALAALSAPAFAADLPSSHGPAVYVPPPLPVFSWTGFYVGGQAGYEFGSDRLNFPIGGGTTSARSTGFVAGGHVGYNYALPALGISGLIVGIEGDVNGSDDKSSNSLFDGPTSTISSNIQGSVRGRLGIAVDRALFYATGGAAFAQIKASDPVNDPVPEFSTHDRVGFTVGGGVEYALTQNWSLRAEYRYTDYGTFSPFTAFPTFDGNFIPSDPTTTRSTENTVTVGFSYLFTSPVVPVVAEYMICTSRGAPLEGLRHSPGLFLFAR